ncbi:MAG: ABC transporter permease [Xanthobacteraceae bacterium]|nr:ABC transporter permease [Xanthobacteraceae bacterium]MBX3532990.1 ABC transporter permease [Xanthobacteraceae bacterium]MCW5674995.1 ABC transporter permease [Xanthobacteraceae bacterium]MCW5679620.1 ABC transporter permease [Xanthobacteraceae bacterium]
MKPRSFAPALVLFAVLMAAWEIAVRAFGIAPQVLPAPSLIVQTLAADAALLFGSLVVTLKITFVALAIAIGAGVALAVLFSSSRFAERALFPLAVVLQVTPVIAIAPLLLVYLEPANAVIACAALVAFFPILSNTALGLASADRQLRDLFALYDAGWLKTLVYLRLPASLPYFLGGLRIAGGLALIGAVVGEIAAGSAGAGSGLAWRIMEAGHRVNIPRMYAALVLIALAGVAIFALFSWLQRAALRRWHASAAEIA